MATCLSMMSFLFVVLMGFLCPSHAHKHTFYVGEKDGWAMKPSESYNQWAERYHYFVHDELVFKYEKGHDSVLVVNEKDYYKCNKDNPIKMLKVKDGESRFKFHQSGPFFFISGHDQNCEDGQKLVVVVHPDPHKTHHLPSPSPVTLPSSPSPSPTTVSFPPVPPPSRSQSHAPPPSHSPSPSPAAGTPFSAHTPLVEPPSNSPSPYPAAETPFPADAPLVEPPSQSPSESPAAQTLLAHAPSTREKAPVPSDNNIALPPHFFGPHHAPAPAPAPSSAPGFGGSFLLIVGLSLAATMISTGLVV